MLLNETAKITKDEFSKIMNDEEFKAGFELEFFVEKSPSYQNNYDEDEDEWVDEDEGLNSDDYNFIADDIRENFEDNDIISKVEISSSDHKDDKDFTTTWYLEDDASIYPSGMELTSPAFSLKDCLKAMEVAFDWVSSHENSYGEYNLGTNESTGFHITLSYKDPEYVKKNFDPLKMAVLLGEDYLLGIFNRKNNERFTAQVLEELKRRIRDNKLDVVMSPDFQTLTRKLTNYIPRSKYYTFNTEKLSSTGVLEYRIAGDDNYHKRINLFRSLVVKYAFLLKICCDPNAYKKDYIHGLMRFIEKNELNKFPGEKDNTNPLYKKYKRMIDSDPQKKLILYFMNAGDNKNRRELGRGIVKYIEAQK